VRCDPGVQVLRNEIATEAQSTQSFLFLNSGSPDEAKFREYINRGEAEVFDL